MNNESSFADIPQELKERRQWVCYRLELRNGSQTKVPYQPTQGGPLLYARSNDPSTWHPFEDAIEATRIPQNQFNGIQYALSDGDPYTFIDLDHVVIDGVVEDWAQDIIDDVGSYTELSQSGTGIHIIARAKKPGPRCNTSKYPKFEIYDNKRLVVFTGKLYPGAPGEIRDAQKSIDELYLRVFGENERKSPSKPWVLEAVPVDVSDLPLIEKAMPVRNGDKFVSLWNGDTRDYNEDHSAADMALCRRLAFWTDCDLARMDRLFRQSGLMRPKWDEMRGDRTYGQRTLEAAIENTGEGYSGISDEYAGEQAAEAELAAARERIAQAQKSGSASAVFEVVDSLAALPIGEYADTVTKLKEVIPQLDLRELKRAVNRKPKPQHVIESIEYPPLIINNRQLRDKGDDALSLLEQANNPPTLFVRSGTLCQVVEDEKRRPVIRPVNEDIILTRLSKICNIVSVTDNGMKNADPPKAIAQYILSQVSWPFPPLEGITRCPTIRQDGSIAQLPGYDSETRLYYHQIAEEVVHVPDNPTSQEIKEALELIEELLCDFPFDCQASKANAIALLLSPLIQPAISDVIPLFLIDAPTAGSGKSLLATVAGIISGGAVPDLTTAPTKEEEWSKKITAILSAGPSLVVMDNVKYTLQSADLAALLTAQSLRERKFGSNTESVILPNRMVWVATGNNIQLGGDIARRCVWIRFDPKQSKPHEREGFLHQPLPQWVSENRGQLLTALLTLCRAWYAAGCPKNSVPAFGSFEKWARAISGILANAGVAGFLANRDRLWEESDTESTEWAAFLSALREEYGEKPFTPKELVKQIEDGQPLADAAPSVILDAVDGKGDKCSRIGRLFAERRGKRYGPNGLRLERGKRQSSGVTWVVKVDEYTSECRENLEPYTDSVANSSVKGDFSVGSVGLQTPSAGEKEHISQGKEITTCELEREPENLHNPTSLHFPYACQNPGCSLTVELPVSSEQWDSAQYQCVCGHRGVVTRQDYEQWLHMQSPQYGDINGNN